MQDHIVTRAEQFPRTLELLTALSAFEVSDELEWFPEAADLATLVAEQFAPDVGDLDKLVKEEMTDRDWDAVNVIIANPGLTVRGVGELLGLSSPSSAMARIDRLESLGLATKSGEGPSGQALTRSVRATPTALALPRAGYARRGGAIHE